MSKVSNNNLIAFADPLCAIMTRIFAIRKVQFVGLMISIAGIGLCGFATELCHVVLLYGIVAGM